MLTLILSPKDFVKQKLKERGSTFEELSAKLDINRTKLFRLLQQDAILPIAIRDKIINILSLSPGEQAEFGDLLHKSNLSISQDLENPWIKFLFNHQEYNAIEELATWYKEGIPFDIELSDFFHLLHSTLEEEASSISDKSKQIRFSIYISGCFYENLLLPLLKITNIIKDAKIHHFVYLPVDDLKKSTINFSLILKSTSNSKYRAYSAIFKDGAGKDGINKDALSKDVLGDMFLIECGNHYFYGDIRKEKLHFFCSAEVNTFSFWKNKFQTIWPHYTPIIEGYHTIEPLKVGNKEEIIKALRSLLESSQILWNLEGSYQHMLFKANMCYDAIPQNIYLKIVNSTMNDLNINMNNEDIALIGDLLSVLDLRYRHKLNSKEHNSIDFYSLDGIKAFLKTGMLSDHIPNTNEISSSDRFTILQSLIYDSKKEQTFHMYVSEKDIFNNKFLLNCFKGYGFVVQHLDDHLDCLDDNEVPYYCVLRLKELSESLWLHMTNEKILKESGFMEMTETKLKELM